MTTPPCIWSDSQTFTFTVSATQTFTASGTAPNALTPYTPWFNQSITTANFVQITAINTTGSPNSGDYTVNFSQNGDFSGKTVLVSNGSTVTFTSAFLPATTFTLQVTTAVANNNTISLAVHLYFISPDSSSPTFTLPVSDSLTPASGLTMVGVVAMDVPPESWDSISSLSMVFSGAEFTGDFATGSVSGDATRSALVCATKVTDSTALAALATGDAVVQFAWGIGDFSNMTSPLPTPTINIFMGAALFDTSVSTVTERDEDTSFSDSTYDVLVSGPSTSPDTFLPIVAVAITSDSDGSALSMQTANNPPSTWTDVLAANSENQQLLISMYQATDALPDVEDDGWFYTLSGIPVTSGGNLEVFGIFPVPGGGNARSYAIVIG